MKLSPAERCAVKVLLLATNEKGASFAINGAPTHAELPVDTLAPLDDHKRANQQPRIKVPCTLYHGAWFFRPVHAL